ncbi:MAG: hypothetical protein ACI9GB_002619 [Halioglobus sp.]|jgi:hypothetical protein
MKEFVRKIPILGSLAQRIFRSFTKRAVSFPGSKNYWESRYKTGGNSGAGSYQKLAAFKAEILNEFVVKNHIETVIEYGCGDGNQLTLSEYPSYVGFDVSEKAIAICSTLFETDTSKRFSVLGERKGEAAQLTISLDVIYHLIEDSVFSDYMSVLFDSATKFVIIYSSNSNGEEYGRAPHVKHREFVPWIESNRPKWRLIQHLENRYPYVSGDNVNGSFSDFYIFSLSDNN